nr:MAG TPA: hypothetical protein [Caudoviricetes sp.]
MCTLCFLHVITPVPPTQILYPIRVVSYALISFISNESASSLVSLSAIIK